MQIKLVQFSTIAFVNIELWEKLSCYWTGTSYIASTDDDHIEYFNRLQLQTTADLPVKLNSSQLHRQTGQCLRQIMIWYLSGI